MVKKSSAAMGITARKIAMTAMLSAVSTVLMYLSFNVPLMPSFIKMDLSELPALLGAFALGPVYGVAVCLIKNAINLLNTTTAGIGELSNFLLGSSFVLTAGLLYQYKRTRTGAIVGSVLGAVAMGLFSLLTNYFLVYPVYSLIMPMDVILGLYKVINPNVSTLWDALLWFNMPFTLAKGLVSVVVTLLIYKKISPLLKGRG